jgi:hypothetical protein
MPRVAHASRFCLRGLLRDSRLTSFLSPSSSHVRFDFHHTESPCTVMKKAAPTPVVRRSTEPRSHGIAMNVTKLFHSLAFVVNVEIVVPRLPEPAILSRKCAGDALLQSLDGFGERRSSGFAHEKVYVIGHDDISVDVDLVGTTNALKREFESARREFGTK